MRNRITDRFAYGDQFSSSGAATSPARLTPLEPSRSSLRETELLRSHLVLTISLQLLGLLVKGAIPAAFVAFMLAQASGWLTQVAEVFPG